VELVHATKALSLEAMDAQIYLGVLQQKREKLLTFWQKPALRHSNILALLLSHFVQGLAVQIANQQTQVIQVTAREQKGQSLHRPSLTDPLARKSIETWLEKSTSRWETSSLRMHDFCKASGCKYVHFFQPNLHYKSGQSSSIPKRVKRKLGYHRPAKWG
jgi:hypothetical protein